MKNGITKISNLDDGKMSAAIKKAVLNFKATTGQAGTTGAITTTKQTASKNQATINPSKIENVEKRLNAADQAIILPVKRPTVPGNTVRKTPKLSEVQQYEDYYRQEQQRNQAIDQAKAQELFERALRHDLFGEPLAKKPTPLESGVIELKDSGSASLGAGSPLAKNGARTRGYTDTASDSGAPIRFTGGTLKDIERKHNEAMARKDDTLDRLYATLDVHHIDRSKLSPEQEEIVGLVEQELIKESVLGTLTERERESVIDRTWKFLYTNTKSVNGDPYPIFIDIVTKDYTKQMIPELGSLESDSFSKEEQDAISLYGRKSSDIPEDDEKYKPDRLFRQKVIAEEVEKYNIDLMNGIAKVGDYQEYYDRAMQRIYETCTKAIPVKDKRGKDAGTIPIGELIPPYDDSFGAQVAREAMRLVGLGYKEPAGQGIYDKMEIDCSRLVNWAVAEVDEDLGINGISKSAGYQMAAIDEPEWNRDADGELSDYGDFLVGDTLFWKGDETGKITHTAIYIGHGLMIEAGKSVQIVPVRDHTTNNNGEDSTLYQINRMSSGELQKNAENNTH